MARIFNGDTLTVTNSTIAGNTATSLGGIYASGGTLNLNNSGVATFSDLSINAAGVGYTLDASIIGLPNVISTPFDITDIAPQITTQPQSATIFSGQTTKLSVVANGSSLSYQWYQGTSGDTTNLIDGATSDAFTTPTLTTTTGYWVRVSNSAGSGDSATATVTVEGAPTITTQPQDTSIFSGQVA